MNKIRVIDLLNKIANGEKIPLKIEVNGYKFRISNGQYWCDEMEIYLIDDCTSINILNDEVKIIEEDKKIRKIKVEYSPDIEEKIFYEDGDKPRHCILGDAGTELLINKINEIIDQVNELKEKK